MPLLHADAEDWWLKGEDFPNLVTALSMDAPTEKQFDVPVQQRKARDVVKALDTAKRWSSKITGLMIAGVGMLAFVTRGGLGAGADLSCTVLYSALMHMVKLKRPLGHKLHVLLDNTVAENKCNTTPNDGKAAHETMARHVYCPPFGPRSATASLEKRPSCEERGRGTHVCAHLHAKEACLLKMVALN